MGRIPILRLRNIPTGFTSRNASFFAAPPVTPALHGSDPPAVSSAAVHPI